ncbi:hypothetical protein [Pelagibacterium limicola]|uniref:hypothetical protein n=1 Tax=Pelagibacterium limicola TaxID=2791022 RepID=UPI0018AF9EAB|nr:hypothetical protein [Pelagibacterium limicola]
MFGRILKAAFFSTALASTAAAGELSIFANGEELATEGFLAPELTRDGWQLNFSNVFVTLSGITAIQAEPPYDAEAGGEPATSVSAGLDPAAPLTIDLTETDEDGRVLLGSIAASAGHHNAISWSVVPATEGEWAGQSMVFVGTATRDGQSVDFTLTSPDRHAYVCGEYVGDERKGFLVEGGEADLEITFHLDHIFGRADVDLDDPMNIDAIGFDPFAAGGTHAIDLSGLHIGHVGEGHCAVVFG